MQGVGARVIGVVVLVVPPWTLQHVKKEAFPVGVGKVAVTKRLPLQRRAVIDAPCAHEPSN